MQACDDYLDSLPEDILAQIDASLDSDSDTASQTDRDSDSVSLQADSGEATSCAANMSLLGCKLYGEKCCRHSCMLI